MVSIEERVRGLLSMWEVQAEQQIAQLKILELMRDAMGSEISEALRVYLLVSISRQRLIVDIDKRKLGRLCDVLEGKEPIDAQIIELFP